MVDDIYDQFSLIILDCIFSNFKFICKKSDDDVNDFMKGFGHILKL